MAKEGAKYIPIVPGRHPIVEEESRRAVDASAEEKGRGDCGYTGKLISAAECERGKACTTTKVAY
jgi:hypothetical protein